LLAPSVYLSITSLPNLNYKLEKKRNINSIGKEIKEFVYPFIKPFYYSTLVSKTTTYAPIQFIFTGLLLNAEYDYKETLYWSRMPSFIFGMTSLLLLMYIFKLVCPKNHNMLSLLGITILSFSWEFIIYSIQSESYAIGVTAALLTFIIFFKIVAEFNTISKRKAFFYGIVLSLLMFSQYQILFFFPGFFISIFILNKQKIIKSSPQFNIILLTTISSFVLLYFVFLKRIMSMGLNWNTGPNNEFLYILKENSFYGSFIYCIHFFLTNSYIMFKSIISIVDENNIINDIISVIFIILFLIGFLYSLKSTNLYKKYFSYFTLISCIVWVFLVINQKLTLSPTRHSLILLSFVAIYVPMGLSCFMELIKLYKREYRKFIFIMFSFSLLFFFINDYNRVIKQRIDKFNPLEIETLINKYKINDVYAYNSTFQLLIMNNFKYGFTTQGKDGNLHFKRVNSVENIGNRMFITHRNSKLNKELINKSFSEHQIIKYDIVYSKELISKTEICFSSLTNNGTNSMLIYIIKPTEIK